MPLMLLLHGTTDSAEGIEAYVRMKPVADAQGFFLLRPSGLPNLYGATSWNATDACCNYKSQPPDDSVYLAGLVEHAASAVAVDRARIVVVGHSAGGFMAYRLACDHADVFAGIASFAGATFKNAGDCSPSAPVHVLEIHGDSDEVVGYRGGSFGLYSSFPGAEQSVATWANYNGCAAERSAGAERDLLSTSGMDTDTGAYAQCAPGGAAELWKMRGAKHIPTLSSSFGSQIAEWLLARPKP